MYLYPCIFIHRVWAQALANQALQLVGADSTAAAAGALLREIGAWGPHMHPATLAFQETALFTADIEVSSPAGLDICMAESEAGSPADLQTRAWLGMSSSSMT